MNRQEYWNQVYQTKGSQDVSWHQRRPDLSLALIAASGVGKDAAIIDVGGGASTLVDFLLDDGHMRLAVLDLSGVALSHSRKRLGARADRVEWFEADGRRMGSGLAIAQLVGRSHSPRASRSTSSST